MWKFPLSDFSDTLSGMARELQFQGISVDLGNEIGHGTFGTVYMGIDIESRVNVAAKRFNKICSDTADPPADIQAELIPLKRELKHENILQVFDCPFKDGYFWILMEYCDTDLEKYTQKHCSQMNYTFKLSIMKQSASGLSFLHQNNIIHRDLKPRNILLKTKSKEIPLVKIADFGTAKLIMEDTSEMTTYAGTKEFMAPELFQSDPEGKLAYKRAVDIYSLGLVFLVLEQAISGKPMNPVMEDPVISPKEANAACIGLAMALRKESGGDYIRPAAILESDSLLKQHVKNLINQMTNTVPGYRPSLDTVENILQMLLDVSIFKYQFGRMQLIHC